MSGILPRESLAAPRLLYLRPYDADAHRVYLCGVYLPRRIGRSSHDLRRFCPLAYNVPLFVRGYISFEESGLRSPLSAL